MLIYLQAAREHYPVYIAHALTLNIFDDMMLLILLLLTFKSSIYLYVKIGRMMTNIELVQSFPGTVKTIQSQTKMLSVTEHGKKAV